MEYGSKLPNHWLIRSNINISVKDKDKVEYEGISVILLVLDALGTAGYFEVVQDPAGRRSPVNQRDKEYI